MCFGAGEFRHRVNRDENTRVLGESFISIENVLSRPAGTPWGPFFLVRDDRMAIPCFHSIGLNNEKKVMCYSGGSLC